MDYPWGGFRQTLLAFSLPIVLKNPRGGVNFSLNGTGSPVPFKEKSHLRVGFFLSYVHIYSTSAVKGLIVINSNAGICRQNLQHFSYSLR